MGATTLIIDKFTNLPVSRQRKHQLRHPQKNRKRYLDYLKTEHGKNMKHKQYIQNKELMNERAKQRYVRIMIGDQIGS